MSQIKITNNLELMMLQTYTAGHLFKNYLEGVNCDLKEALTNHYKEVLDSVKDDKSATKKAQKMLRYKMNRFKKENEEILDLIDSAISGYMDSTETSNIAVNKAVDNLDLVLQNIISKEDDGTISITMLSLNENK